MKGSKRLHAAIDATIIVVILLSLSVFASAAQQSANTVVLPADKDTYIDKSSPADNFGDERALRIGQQGNSGKLSRALLEFNLTDIPAGAIITDAVLRLSHDVGNQHTDIAVHRVTSDWTEDGATWDSYSSEGNWTEPGGDFEPNASVRRSASSESSAVELALGELVQGWVNGTWPNYGLIVKQDDESAAGSEIFFSSEDGRGRYPALIINYTSQPNTTDDNSTSGNTTNATFVKPNITATKFDGLSTDFGAINDTTNISTVTLEIAGIGKIVWNGINISIDADLDQNIEILYNLILVNSTALPFFNTSATITLSGITFNNPKPQYDLEDDGAFEDCPDSVCTEVGYSNGTYVFTVAHFTSYRLAEGEYCGDGFCNGGETCSNCRADCGSCKSGSRTSPSETPRNMTNETAATPEANATATNEVTIVEQPRQCQENWVCGDWSFCQAPGIQTRFCTDRSNCGTENIKPPEQQSCNLPAPSCHDGLQNQDETGIDCGGSCTPCYVELPKAGQITIPSQREPNSLLATITIVMLLALIAVASLSMAELSKRTKLLLTGMHVMLIATMLALLAVTLTNPKVSGNVLAEGIDITQVATLAVGIVLLLAIFLLSGRMRRLIANRIHKLHSRTHRKSGRAAISGTFDKLMHTLASIAASKGERIDETSIQKLGSSDEPRPMHDRMTDFEHNVHKRVGSLHDSLHTFRKTVATLHSEVSELRRENRELKSHIGVGTSATVTKGTIAPSLPIQDVGHQPEPETRLPTHVKEHSARILKPVQTMRRKRHVVLPVPRRVLTSKETKHANLFRASYGLAPLPKPSYRKLRKPSRKSRKGGRN